MSAKRLVVFAWGNDARGDDALGPAFHACAQAHADPPGVATTYVADWQLQPEHTIDLDGQDLALFVDASVAADPPFAFRALIPARPATFTTHGMTPSALLDAFGMTFGRAPPPAFELAIRGERFELGMPLGPSARAHLEAALGFFARLRADPTPRAWLALAGSAE